MLKIVIPVKEFFDEEAQEFVTEAVTLELEHSLVSLSKWESEFEKPFLTRGEKTDEEVTAYIRCMVVTPDFPPGVFDHMTADNYAQINKYIDAKMTATWFSELPGAPKTSEVITSELIYYWLVTFNIPFEVQEWHLNRLFTLVKVCNMKNAKPKKMSRSELAARNQQLNEQRKKQLGTNG